MRAIAKGFSICLRPPGLCSETGVSLSNIIVDFQPAPVRRRSQRYRIAGVAPPAGQPSALTRLCRIVISALNVFHVSAPGAPLARLKPSRSDDCAAVGAALGRAVAVAPIIESPANVPMPRTFFHRIRLLPFWLPGVPL